MLRISGGKYKGMRLEVPPTDTTRPSSQKLRQAIFNMVAFEVDWSNAVVCDAFAGSGAFGLEALSMGAKKVVFCEPYLKTAKILRRNIEHVLQNETNQDACVLWHDFFQLKPTPFDIIFLDPPYHKNLEESALKYISNQNFLKDDGLIILEQHKESSIPKSIFQLHKQRTYGQCQVSFLRKYNA